MVFLHIFHQNPEIHLGPGASTHHNTSTSSSPRTLDTTCDSEAQWVQDATGWYRDTLWVNVCQRTIIG
jgi:hypothetical protein